MNNGKYTPQFQTSEPVKEDEEMATTPTKTPQEINFQPQRFVRKDSTVSFSPSTYSNESTTNSLSPILEKTRTASQSSYAESDTSTTDYKVEVAKLRLIIKISMSLLIPIIIVLSVSVIYLIIAVNSDPSATREPVRSSPSHASGLYQDKEGEVCVECAKLTMPIPEENKNLDSLIKKIEKGKQICCAQTPEQTDIFMERYFDHKLKEERANGGLCMATSAGLSSSDLFRAPSSTSSTDKARCTDAQNPSVHLIGTEDTGSPDGSSIIKSWADSSDIAFRNGVRFEKTTGKLVVPQPGFYYVYSQIHFIQIFPRVSTLGNPGAETPDRRPNSNSLTHKIRRSHVNYYTEDLLSRRQSQCWVTNKLYSEYTSYIGGVLNLRRGDEIFIEVSNKTMVSNQSKMNFFGMFFVAPSATAK